MKILIIDDEESAVKGIKDWATDSGIDCECLGFSDGLKSIDGFDPDIVILDWKEGATVNAGEDIFKSIWNKKFRPIIVFSGIADTIDLPIDAKNSPLVKKINKGNEEPVIKSIEIISKFAPSITQMKDSLHNALKQSFDVLDIFIASNYNEQKIVDYMIARRLSNYFDKEYEEEIKPPAWIQYICPPINKKLLVGDIIRVYTQDTELGEIGVPEEFLVVLTPSCDIANGKVTKVLCAKCTTKKKISDKTNCSPGKRESCKEEVKAYLAQGYNMSIAPLPGMPTKLPNMSVQLKEVTLVDIAEIALSINTVNDTTHKYYRVATIDSPYREQLVWAHMINSCRPGVPERDYEKWADEIFNEGN